ncbi:Methyltransferase domain containing protein [Burkholderiaceae bacterium]
MLMKLGRKLPTSLKTKLKKIFNRKFRRSIAMSYYEEKLALIDKWICLDKETSNFYYRLTPLNRDQLAQMIATVTGAEYNVIIQYFDELEGDTELRRHLEDALRGTKYGTEINIDYARRLGWYAFIRVLKPRVVVETGVDHGVGSCVLASALLRNIAEGHAGQYYGTEIRKEAGQLFSGKYASVGKILYDDSITSLKKLEEKIDLFVNDSDHSGEYEYQEYVTIVDKLADKGIILGDNAHVTDSLSRFSKEKNRKYLFFCEKPEDHWYPGAGIGVSFK